MKGQVDADGGDVLEGSKDDAWTIKMGFSVERG